MRVASAVASGTSVHVSTPSLHLSPTPGPAPTLRSFGGVILPQQDGLHWLLASSDLKLALSVVPERLICTVTSRESAGLGPPSTAGCRAGAAVVN